jgi:dienelactone hydrolase
MNIERVTIDANGINIPSIILIPSNTIGVAIITHGYGGCKEEQLGLAYRVAELGITTCVIDLRGHGENTNLFDGNILLDIEDVIKYCRNFGQKVVAIGHSLGGRLSLISSADYAVGISPALDRNFSEKTQEILNNMRGYRVKQSSNEKLFKVIEMLPTLNDDNSKNKIIIYGSRDVPEIVNSSSKLKETGLLVKEVNNALHNDIFTVEDTFKYLIEQLNIWFKINQ